MESICLPREDYKDFLSHLLKNKALRNEELVYYIERAKIYFDYNIVGSNYYLSIIIEQFLKNEEVDVSFLDAVYALREEMFFSIEEHDYEFINDLFNNFPKAYWKHYQEYSSAIQRKDEDRIEFLKSRFGEPFEQDLNRIMYEYYETKVRY